MTAAEPPTMELGEEVPLREIDGRLKQLWESGDAMTRASLMNFAVYAECPDSLEKNTEVIREVTREHACRALLIAVEPACETPSVRAWITAHCQLGDGGKKSVCSEQISFLIRGCGTTVVANTIFAHVDSDLPLTLWWQGDFSGNWEPHLFTEIDRLVIDSSEWEDPLAQFEILQKSHCHAASEFSVNDLTWTRVLHLRMALSACFDDPAALALLPVVESVEITCAPGHLMAGRFFAAWAAHRAGWKLTGAEKPGRVFKFDAGGRTVRLSFTEKEAATAVPSVILRGAGLTVSLTQEDDSRFIHGHVETSAGSIERLVPCPCRTPAELVVERLRRGCNTKLYFTLLETVRAMMGA
ncbi:MAG TPA: glucose-6-phosphate dehydrogenase assembly protein OpcA [Verrucomicrobiales bacterium]|nr:glucose-6-phosphate dehydrogenase assembly protein OpcA [Verrucomicrobiales bacterium]